MDRPTEVTIRSAIIIGCMIIVPLWAVMGTTLTGGFRDEAAHETASRPSRPVRTAAKAEPRHEPIRTETAAVDPANITVPAVLASQGVIAPTNVPMSTPGVIVPVTNVTSITASHGSPTATPIPPAAPLVDHATVVQSSAAPSAVAHLPPIATTPAHQASAVQLSVQARTVPASTHTGTQTAAATVPAENAAAPPSPVASPGDWFQWTEGRLRQMGASQFILESASEQGGYRFRCKAALVNDPGFVRHFEATGKTALEAMQNVLGQIEAWRASIR